MRNLQLLVSALSSSSDLLAAFNTNLADITTVLSNTPNEVANATQGLDGAVNDLRGFVAENREGLGVTFDHLNAITTALNDSRGDVKQVLHIAPAVFQNFMNIYQPAQSAVTGILAPVNFANTVQFICSAIQAASRENWEQSSKMCVQYLAPIIKNRQYTLPATGYQPIRGSVGAAQRDHLQRRPPQSTLAAATAPDVPAALNDPAEPLAAEAAIGDLPPAATTTDPTRTPRPDGASRSPAGRHAVRRVLAAALIAACMSAIPGCEWRGLNSLSLPGTEGDGDGSYTIQAQLPDVVVIQQNTRVRVADVNVGNVTKIEVQDWHALVTMRINGDVHLPANSTAKSGRPACFGVDAHRTGSANRRDAAG